MMGSGRENLEGGGGESLVGVRTCIESERVVGDLRGGGMLPREEGISRGAMGRFDNQGTVEGED